MGTCLWVGTVTANSEDEALGRAPEEARDVYQAMPWGPPDSYDLRERKAMAERSPTIEALGREIRNAEVERRIEAAKNTRMRLRAYRTDAEGADERAGG